MNANIYFCANISFPFQWYCVGTIPRSRHDFADSDFKSSETLQDYTCPISIVCFDGLSYWMAGC